MARPTCALVAIPLALLVGCSAPEGAGPINPPSIATATATAPASTATAGSPSSAASRQTSSASPAQQVIASNLDVPWAIAFLPDGSALVTLRDRAQLLLVREGTRPVTLGAIAGVQPDGEGGLLGVAVSPRYRANHRVFLYYTAANDNRVVRLTFADGKASEPEAILTGIPKAGHHDGGRLAFGPDSYLYVTTGDAGQTDRAQDLRSLGGKILRVTEDGEPAADNPFGSSRVWSYGHRNVQGMAWAPDGSMYASEFGQDTWDELNLIKAGKNYGWPVVEGIAGRQGMVDPLAQWPTSEASPSGIAYSDGAVLMTALRGQCLWRIPVSGGQVRSPTRLLDGRYGRLRDAVVGPDGRLWILTSNTFRGDPRPNDDRIVAIPLKDLR
jgi:glucose/arabinose dehydrogenase